MMIAIVGPSGAGKDSLINLARAHFKDDPCIGFVRRVITRPADGATEDHVPADADHFAALERDGRFAVTWGAHGLRYGIPRETVDEIAAGRTLLANGSRSALGRFRAAYPDLALIEISARPDVIAARLAQRGRESAAEIEKRLVREADAWRPDCPLIRIDNSGALTEAADALCAAVERLMSQHRGTFSGQ